MKKITLLLMMLLTAFSMNAQTSYGNLTSGNSGTGGGTYSSYLGHRAGELSTGNWNTFLGARAGIVNTTGQANVFVGHNAGYTQESGDYNVFVGNNAGRSNVSGEENTYIGYRAGYNNTSSKNVFLGYRAGYNELGSNKLYIDNSSTPSPLIKGDFSANALTFNGTVGVGANIPTGTAIPMDIQLYVDGRFSQLAAGDLGGFTPTDRWSSLGESFAPTNLPIPDIYGMLNQGYGASFISGVKQDETNGANSTISWSSGNRLDFDVIDAGGLLETRVSFLSNGKVSIGDITTPGQYKLYVEEGILAEKVMIATNGSINWADYVFDEDYDLNTTEEVETFIKENKHLPNVPSAEEVNEKGVDIVQMDATLLRQIEELWLHVIELKKENEALNNQIKALKQ